jgi:hypothetical protein
MRSARTGTLLPAAWASLSPLSSLRRSGLFDLLQPGSVSNLLHASPNSRLLAHAQVQTYAAMPPRRILHGVL